MQSRVVASVILVGPDTTVLLLRRSDSAMRRAGEYDIPGGHADADEYGNEAAARETLEEAGITLDPRQLRLCYSEAKSFPDTQQSVVWLFYIGHTETDAVKISSEHSEYRWTSLEEAIAMIDYDRQKRALQYVYDNGLGPL